MNLLRKIINVTYPFRMKISKRTGLGIDIRKNKNNVHPKESFHSLSAISNSGEIISFEKYKGKKILLVNLASQCGYTPQYKDLEDLHQRNNEIIILGFPANNFGKQEPGNDKEIAEFCKVNFGVTFPLFKKDEVKGNSKQPVYQWLTDKNKNGWNDVEPQWNFYKYLVDEEGNLANVYSSSVSPMEIGL
ncbi:MAG TPA: glutathione peroxidase [Hanamia sp.]|nr:glutathione peroxidase [Hanamia sp.]